MRLVYAKQPLHPYPPTRKQPHISKFVDTVIGQSSIDGMRSSVQLLIWVVRVSRLSAAVDNIANSGIMTDLLNITKINA